MLSLLTNKCLKFKISVSIVTTSCDLFDIAYLPYVFFTSVLRDHVTFALLHLVQIYENIMKFFSHFNKNICRFGLNRLEIIRLQSTLLHLRQKEGWMFDS